MVQWYGIVERAWCRVLYPLIWERFTFCVSQTLDGPLEQFDLVGPKPQKQSEKATPSLTAGPAGQRPPQLGQTPGMPQGQQPAQPGQFVVPDFDEEVEASEADMIELELRNVRAALSRATGQFRDSLKKQERELEEELRAERAK